MNPKNSQRKKWRRKQQRTRLPKERPRINDSGERTLFCSSLPHTITQPQLMSIFGRFGKIDKIRIKKKKSQLKITTATIAYSNPRSLQKALRLSQEIKATTGYLIEKYLSD